MAKVQYARLASNNPIIRVFIQDSSKTDGSGLAALTSASSGLAINIMRELDAAPTLYSQGGGTIEAVSVIGTYAAPTATKCRFIKIDDTNLPGWYEIQFAQALFGAGDGSRFVSGMVFGATNAAPTPFEVQLTGTNMEDAVHGGMSALPNAAADAAGGLPISDAGGLDIDEMNVDIEAIETRVTLALPAVAPQGAGGLITSTAGSFDIDEMNVDVEAIETRVTLALPNAAPQAAGGLVTSTAGSLDLDEMNDDIEAIQTAVGSGGVQLDLTQAVPNSNTAETVGDCLNAARAQGFGKWVLSGSTLDLYADDGTTIVRSFTLDSATTPTQRV